MSLRFIAVFNRDGGTFRTLDMAVFAEQASAIFAAEGHVLEPRIVGGKDLLPELKRACSDPSADVVLAGGGDGTISAAAAACFSAGKTLAILPAGTMNFFARTLRVPLNLDEALTAIAQGREYSADIATANGRVFVHQYSVGVYARLVRIREEHSYRNRWEKMFASARSVLGAISKPLHFHVEIITPKGPEQRIASGISVTNNTIGEGHMPHADDIDGGVLGVYLAKPMSRWDMLKLFVQVVFGHWKDHPRVSEKQVTSVTLNFPARKRSARAAIDGELVPLAPHVTLRTHPRALKVFAPQALAEVTGQTKGPAPEEQGTLV